MEFVLLDSTDVRNAKLDGRMTLNVSRNMREQDLLRCLELFPGENPNSGVDCTLKLGLSLDQPISESITNQTPITKNFSMMNNYGSPSPKVMENYGMVNEGNAHNSWEINNSNYLNWLLKAKNIDHNRDVMSFIGGSSMEAHSNSNVWNNFGGHMSLTPMPQNNVSESSFFKQLTESKPNDSYKRCVECKTTNTPLWRNGPCGIKTLCNACGIRYKRKEKRALGIVENYSRPKSVSMKGRDFSEKSSF